jgi:hypothetical protein
MWSEGRAGERRPGEEQQQANHPRGAGRLGVHGKCNKETAGETWEGYGRGGRWRGTGTAWERSPIDELPRLGPCPNYNATSLGSGLARAAARHPSPYCNNNINAIRGDMNATHKRGTSDERVMNAHFKREESDERG